MSAGPRRAVDEMRRRLAGRPVVVVSPHLDDAAISAYWLLTEPDDVQVVTVCTAAPSGRLSDWDRELGFASGAAAIEVRIGEDRRALGLTGADPVHLGLHDAAYRSPDDQAAFERDLAGGVATIVGDRPGVTLALPAAFGAPANRIRQRRDRTGVPMLRTAPGAKQHRDHCIVRDVLLAAHARSVPIVFYEDLPYARSGGTAQLRRAAANAGLDVRRVAVPIDLRAKERVVRAYASQYASFLPVWARRFEDGFAPTERYWWSTIRDDA